MTDSSGYLMRLRVREACLKTKQSAVFAQVGGAILFLFFGFKLLFVLGGPDELWLTFACAGAVLFLAGVVMPNSAAPLERWFVRGTRYLGEAFLYLILSIAFFLVITPIGLLLRVVRGTSPFYAWQLKQATQAPLEGWTAKAVVVDHREPELDASKTSLIAQPANVIRYFVRHGHYFLVPVLLILVSFGLLLFFIQSSSLAPFIYTLF